MGEFEKLIFFLRMTSDICIVYEKKCDAGLNFGQNFGILRKMIINLKSQSEKVWYFCRSIARA